MATSPVSQRPDSRRLAAAFLLRAALQPALLVPLLFLPAGTLAWPMGWMVTFAYVVGLLGTNLWLSFRQPDLAWERLRIPKNAQAWDLRLTGAANTLLVFVMLPLSGLDFRFHWSSTMPAWIALVLLPFFAASFLLHIWAMSANPFFSSAVRLQTDRSQTVAQGGPYRFIRHPGYLTMIAQFLSIPFLLGSYWAILPAVGAAGLYILRTAREDAFLQAQLPGYQEYSAQVRFRLFPGVW